MAKQNAVSALKESIRLVEIRQAEEGRMLKEQFRTTIESLKPINLIKNSIRDLASSVNVKDNLYETIFSIVSGYLTRKFLVSSKSSTFMKIAGVMMQFGVTNLLAKNSDEIRYFFSNLIERFLNPAPKEEIPEREV